MKQNYGPWKYIAKVKALYHSDRCFEVNLELGLRGFPRA